MRINKSGRRSNSLLGFTLIEVLLAVLLIGVLTAVALPQYSKYRDRVNIAKAVTDISGLQVVISKYFTDNGQYPPSLAEVGGSGMLDPWGNAYVYVNLSGVNGNGQARKDHKLNPINSDFDLYSMGKDGVTKSQLTQKDSLDDIVRASDGKFIGLASDFSP